jgi:hypothetical protein
MFLCGENKKPQIQNQCIRGFNIIIYESLIRKNTPLVDDRQIGSSFFVDGISSKNKGFIE